MKDLSSKSQFQAISEKSNCYSRLESIYSCRTGSSLFLDPTAPPPCVVSDKLLTVTIVIPCWNVKSSILACLASIEQSSFNLYYQNRLQVVIVDDGSTDGTWELIKKSLYSLHIIAIRQNHQNQACALNTGIRVAEGDIIISCDADMVLNYYTIEHFVARHQQLPNILLIGFRSNIIENDYRLDAEFIRQHGSPRGTCFTEDERIAFPISGWPSNMCLVSDHLKSLGYARTLWMPDNDAWGLPDMVVGALFSLSKSIYSKIGGYDERFYGWGCTDSYLTAKAISVGQYVIPVYAASGLHINHRFRAGNKKSEYTRNRNLYYQLIRKSNINNYQNYLVRAKKRIIESFISNPKRKSYKLDNNISFFKKNEIVNNKADCLLAIGEYSRAIEFINKNMITYDKSARLLRLGKAYLGLKKYQEAINNFEDFSKSVNLASESTIQLAIAQAANGKFRSAHITLKKLSLTHPQSRGLPYWYNCSAEDRIRQGKKFYNQKFYSIALRCFEAALIIEPNNKTALKFREKCFNDL